MNDTLLRYIRRRRAELERELSDLNAAERVCLMGVGASSLPARVSGHLLRKTLKQMVIELLAEAAPRGLTASELVSEINRHRSNAVTRRSLAVQLTRLKKDRLIRNTRPHWYLADIREDGGQPGGEEEQQPPAHMA